jgi:hypothetical protein
MFAWMRLILRWRSGTLASLAAVHAILVTWVAWYVAEASWGSAPIGVSPTPLPPIAFQASWLVGALFLVGVGPAIGAGAFRGPWSEADPTRSLSLGILGRTAPAWCASAAILTLVALAPLPTYLVLAEMGSFSGSQIAQPLLAQGAAIVIAPMLGIACAALRRGRRWVEAPVHV